MPRLRALSARLEAAIDELEAAVAAFDRASEEDLRAEAGRAAARRDGIDET